MRKEIERMNWDKYIQDYRTANPESKKTMVEIIQEYYENRMNEKLMDKKLGTKSAL